MTYRANSTWGLLRNPAVFGGFFTAMAVIGGWTSGAWQGPIVFAALLWLFLLFMVASDVYSIRVIGPTVEFRRLRGPIMVPAGKIAELERCYLPSDEEGRAAWMVYVRYADGIIDLSDSHAVRRFAADLYAAYPTVRLTGEWPAA
jgi:hypothetical protein